jgi:hypothetical protein
MTTRWLGEGETTPVTTTLYDGDGATRTAAVLTGLTLGILVTDRTGASVNVSGKASVVTAASGTVKFEPDVNDFKAANSPYRVTWTVTDGNSDVAWYPNREPESWVVRKP